MHDALGVGLAATQLGVLHRVLVYRAFPEDPVTALVNPVLEWASEELEVAQEGCLSLPGVHVEVERPAQVKVRAQDEHGQELRVEAEGLAARVIQHEIDHLDGRADTRSHLARGPQGGDARDARGAGGCGRGLNGGRGRVRKLSTVFLGTSAFAAAILERLADSPHRPALVVTRPDRARGRGRRAAPPPVAAVARALGIELEQPEDVNSPDATARIARARPQTVVVCAFGALIKEPLLSEHELLNVHPSLLPRWRGAAPVERAIMAGDAVTGVSIMRVTAGLDSGPVCLAAPEPIGHADTYGSLAPRLQRLGGDLLLRVLDDMARGVALAFTEQDGDEATYAEKIGPEDRLLDPARAASELERVVRALHPHIVARVALADGTLLGVHRAALTSTAPVDSGPAEDTGRPRTQGRPTTADRPRTSWALPPAAVACCSLAARARSSC